MQAWIIFKKNQNGQKYFTNSWCTATSYKKNSMSHCLLSTQKFPKRLISLTPNMHPCECVSGCKKH